MPEGGASNTSHNETEGVQMHRFIIVGGGAGGLELATRLGDKFGDANGKRTPRAQVTLVDRYSTHIWKPLLHEVAAGSMDPFTQELPYAAQARWHGFEFQQGDLLGLDRAAKRITLAPLVDKDEGELMPRRELDYDTLIIAIGSTTAFFGITGAQENSIALDTVEQAELFRKRLIAARNTGRRSPSRTTCRGCRASRWRLSGAGRRGGGVVGGIAQHRAGAACLWPA